MKKYREQIIRNSILLSFWFFLLPQLQSQSDLRIVTAGNGYVYEQDVAKRVLGCILNGCLTGLERSKFIQESTQYDKEIIASQINSLRNYWENLYLWRAKKEFVYSAEAEPLTYVQSYYDDSKDSLLFQLRLELEYISGLLRAKSIDILHDNFIVLSKSDLDFKYESENRTYPNPPPPAPPYPPKAEWIYKGISLCQNYCSDPPIRIERKRNYYLLDEKYIYQRLERLHGKLLLAQKGDYYGIINYENKVIVPIEYDSITKAYNNKYYVVFREGKAAAMSLHEGIVIPFMYNSLDEKYAYNDEEKRIVFVAEKNGFFGIIDVNMNNIIPLAYDEIEVALGRYLLVERDGQAGIIDFNEDILIPLDFDEIRYLSTNVIVARKNDYYEIYGVGGNKMTRRRYQDVTLETNYRGHEIFRIVDKKGKIGLYLLVKKDEKFTIEKISDL